MNVTYAEIRSHSAWLSQDFGRDYAMRIFDLTEEELEEKVGRFVRGKRKGELKGKIIWQHATRGGWVKTGSYNQDQMRGSGYVVKPGKRWGHSVVLSVWGEPDQILLEKGRI